MNTLSNSSLLRIKRPRMGIRQLLCSHLLGLNKLALRMSLSPLLFAIYLNDIDSIADGVKGALTGTPNFW